jgi:hypothetical protein
MKLLKTAFFCLILLALASPALAEDRYVLTLGLAQTRWSLSISEHLKDAANETQFEIPVDKTFYDSVSVGQKLNDKFRSGSLFFGGSIGSWKVWVKNKRVVKG